MNIQALSISVELSGCPSLFPERSCSKKDKEKVTNIWERILFKGEGFEGENASVVGKTLVAYLKSRRQCKGNFVSFCDRFWGTIAPKIEEAAISDKDLNEVIERIFSIFKIVSKDYIEADKRGLGFTPVVTGNIEVDVFDAFLEIFKTDFTKFSSVRDLGSRFINGTAAHLRNFFIPWSLFTIPAACSRYRTARQCSVGMSRMANKFKQLSSKSEDKVQEEYRKFVTVMKTRPARQLENDGRIVREEEKNIHEIKDLQAFIIASTVVRVCLAVASCGPFLMVSSVVLSFIFPVWIAGILGFAGHVAAILKMKGLNGTAAHAVSSLAILGPKFMAFVGLFDIIGMSHIIMASGMPVPAIIIPVLIILFLSTWLFVSESLSKSEELKHRFHQNTLQDDALSPILKPLTSVIKALLDLPLYLVDGAEQKILV